MQTSMLFAFFTMTNASEAVFIHVDKKGLGVYYVLILITLILILVCKTVIKRDLHVYTCIAI